MAYVTKVYVVQKDTGEVVAVKLTREAAQRVAVKRGVAPAAVIFSEADKSDSLNVEQPLRHRDCS